jgi:hypothetical protein
MVVSCCVPPMGMAVDVGETVSDDALPVPLVPDDPPEEVPVPFEDVPVTETDADAARLPTVATSDAAPGPTAVAYPLDEIETTFGLVDDQMIVCPLIAAPDAS